ncbi:RNA degradosome polyphosphate kinase [Chromatiales bacterium (ex Bugula neritina AB1)]|nr:RNA degradosome polyphosphate kinase [Chromatiales bacterium (ex Bugula neritina AB1)]
MDPQSYFNRELSFLAFNRRVLLLAFDDEIPLLERLRYLCICSSNLDEFFEVRVAGLQQQLQGRFAGTGPDKLTPEEQLSRISKSARFQVRHQYRLLNRRLLPALKKNGIEFLAPGAGWTPGVIEWATHYFITELLPVLSPLGLDRAHPFPLLMNKSLNFIVKLSGKDAFGRDTSLAVVRAPRSLPRIIRVPSEFGNGDKFVFLSTMIEENIERLFPGLKVEGTYQFRVTRNSDLYLEDEDAADLRLALQDELSTRNFGEAVRLEVDSECPDSIVQFLLREFRLQPRDLFSCDGPVNLSRLQSLPERVDRPDLEFLTFVSHTPKSLGANRDLFSRIRRADVMLHYPYESSSPVVNLLRKAARDKQVLAIKQTLYRTGTESVYVDALLEAAANGKDVTVVIELRARFDEEANIELARRLQREGVQVVYGVVGIKAHAKMTLIVRREQDRLIRYANVATGNYHTRTARVYTDISLLTADENITVDVQNVFNQLSGLGKVPKMQSCLHSPFNLHKKLMHMIEEQTALAAAGKPCGIKARMNSLSEAKLVRALYRASQAGVQVQLLVRGICILKPGIEGLSENISVCSVVGRFLEHSRVFAFGPEGKEKVYISSADWMPRNMFNRVELAVPVVEPKLRSRVISETLNQHLADNRFSWELLPTGRYRRKRAQEERFSVQENLLQVLNLDKK